MTRLVWDAIGTRFYENGLDRGVLYIPDGPAVPWNGLTSITEKFDQERSPIHFDGMKINDLVALGDFAATMKAITYPDQFIELEGMAEANRGMLLGNQSPKIFNLSYRTMLGNDINEDAGYKIHILYNVIAIPSERDYSTRTDSFSFVEFEWDITAVPEEVVGFRPTAHIIINSKDFDAVLLQLLENLIYGSNSTTPNLPSMSDLMTYLNDWFRVRIIDNDDGTWSAYSSQPGVITFPATGEFQIENVSGAYVDADMYQITNTLS